MTIVDCHIHVNLNGWSSGDIIKYMDKEHIDYSWLVSWEEINPGPWPYQHVSVEEIYEAYLKYPSRIVPFYAPDPHRNDAVARLEHWYQKGIRGCGELKTTLDWDLERVRSILRTAGRLRMPFVFHMGPIFPDLTTRNMAYRLAYRFRQSALRLLVKGYTPSGMLRDRIRRCVSPGYLTDFKSLEIALRDFPDVNFVAHGTMFWQHISGDAEACKEALPRGPIIGEGVIWRLLRDYPNLYADTSGNSGHNALTRDPENAKRFLSLFEDKLLYGTDNIMKEQRESLKSLLKSLGLSKGTYKKIYGDNACRLLER